MKKFYLPIIAMIIALLLPQFVTNRYYMHIFIVCLMYIIIAQALNLLVGNTEYLSFAHNAMYGIGAYASAILVRDLGWSFWVSVPVAGIITAILAMLVGYLPLTKLKGSYFALVTMAFGLVIVSVLHNWESLTGGPSGFQSIPGPGSFFGISLDTRLTFYYFVLVIAALTILLMWRISKTKLGRVFKSIGQDEGLAEAIGVHIGYYKLLCFVISAGITGIVGSFYAHYSRFLGPDMFSITEAVDMLTMVIIGGMGTIIGPIIGAVVIVVLPEMTRGLAEYRQVFFSIFLIATLMFMPGGLYSLIGIVRERIFGSKNGANGSADSGQTRGGVKQ